MNTRMLRMLYFILLEPPRENKNIIPGRKMNDDK